MKKFQLKVEGMKCHGCATTIKNKVESLDEDKIKCEVSLESSEVTVEAKEDSKISIEDIKIAIKEAGYRPV